MRASLLALFFFARAAIAAEPMPFVDTHAHLDHQGERGRLTLALDNALADMDRNGVRLTFLMPPPQPQGMRFLYDLEGLKTEDPRYANRFGFIAGGGSLNPMIQDVPPDRVSGEDRRRFRIMAEELFAAGVRAFGEIAVHHVSHARMGGRHPYESVPADHPLLLLLADIAAERGISTFTWTSCRRTWSAPQALSTLPPRCG